MSNEMQVGKGLTLSDVSVEVITASGGVGIPVMYEICQTSR